MLVEFIRNHLANKWDRKSKGQQSKKLYKRIEDQAAESYGYNLISGINSDLMF